MKRILTAFICLLLLFPCAAAHAESSAFAGGEGTADKPYLIETETQLCAVSLYPDACFLLTRDITCSADWEPIGTRSVPFTGVFDGDGHTVSGLRASASIAEEACLGLFGWNSGTIRNVRVENCSFSVHGTITYAGGIAAINTGTIELCRVSGQIYAACAAGGITGKSEISGTVRCCHSSASVSADIAGGICGISAGRTQNCLNTGSVSGNAAGGIIGQGPMSAYCCNTGAVSGALCGGIIGDLPGGYIGQNDGSNCFFLDTVSQGTGNGGSCVKLTASEMTLAESFPGFDFQSVWYMGSSHPLLRMKTPPKPVVPQSIEITTLPKRTQYTEGESFCPDGLCVTLRYSDGTSVPVTDYLLGGYEPTVGEHTVTVTHSGFSATFSVKVTVAAPDAITSSIYAVTPQWLRKIPPYTTVNALKKGLDGNSFIAVFNDENPADSNSYVRTGMTIAIVEGAAKKFSLTAVVTGDTDSDGKLTATDLPGILHHLLKQQPLSGPYAQAADCNDDSKVTLTDFLLLKAHILGKSTL